MSSSAVTYRIESPNRTACRHSAGSSGLASSQRISCPKYCSAMTVLSRPAAAAISGVPPPATSQSVDVVVARHGFSRPVPPPASSTSPYLASCRRWKEQVPDDWPSNSAARVAVSGPSVRSSPTSAIRTGWA